MNATVETVSANMTSFHSGLVPSSIESSSAVEVDDEATPKTMISSCSATSTSTSAAIRSRVAPPKPRMLRTAT